MNHKYIDKNTFNVVDNVFEVDDDIVESISILNKKGYKTKFCCAGHIKDPNICYKFEIKKEDLKDFIDYYIVKEENDKLTLFAPQAQTATYVMFESTYVFPFLPKNFTLEDNVIERLIDYYKDDKRRDVKEVLKEIEEVNKELLDWVKLLPELKEV